jgi:hypothetical protein
LFFFHGFFLTMLLLFLAQDFFLSQEFLTSAFHCFFFCLPQGF